MFCIVLLVFFLNVYVFGSYFRTLAVIFLSVFSFLFLLLTVMR